MNTPRVLWSMPPADRALVQRLETLSGSDGDCCAVEFRAKAVALRAAPPFAQRLRALKALADENRLLAASLLKREGELCACELQAALGLTHATVSHHLGILAKEGIVTSERRGKWTHYRLTPAVKEWIP